MERYLDLRRLCLFAMVGLVTGCATNKPLFDPPAVNLTSVEVSEISLTNQTVQLAFNVSNPNPIPIPVRSVKYSVRLNDQNFVGGETKDNFTVPPRGDESFVISVEFDLLQSATQLGSLVRSGVRDNLHYEFYGDLRVDLPMAPSMQFSDRGTIMVQSEIF